jgi:hypothetical protein
MKPDSKAAEHREIAANVRSWLRHMHDDDSRKMAVTVADDYDTLADAEEALNVRCSQRWRSDESASFS